MPVVGTEADSARSQLKRILESPGFARNERLSRFLKFVVEQHLEGRTDELKESVIAVEVFGRTPDFNARRDPIVRTEAARLRARLGEYYLNVGLADSVVIEIPKGGYAPVVRPSAQLSQSIPAAPGNSPSRVRTRRWAWLAAAALAVVSTAVGWVRVGPFRGPRVSTNPEAHDLYLRARASEMQRALSGVEASIEMFEQAIAKDPKFAPAYAGVAAMEAARSAFDRFSPAERAEMIAKGWAFAGEAMRLDSRLPDAYDALAMMQAREAQWIPAERSFRRAIELAPSDPTWHNHFAMFLLLPVGRIDEAIGHLRASQALNTGSPQTHHALMLALRAAGRFADSEFHCQASAVNDQQMSECWAETYFRQEKVPDAVRVLEEQWANRLMALGAQSLGVAYARAGRRGDAERVAAAVPRPANKGRIFAALADKDRTLDALQQMVPMGPTRLGRELIAPEYAFLRGDPRLSVLRRRVGLPE
jgi:tetratricopeptide (TPR) repeat protein